MHLLMLSSIKRMMRRHENLRMLICLSVNMGQHQAICQGSPSLQSNRQFIEELVLMIYCPRGAQEHQQYYP
jgi:hypothetical protein